MAQMPKGMLAKGPYKAILGGTAPHILFNCCMLIHLGVFEIEETTWKSHLQLWFSELVLG